MKKGGHTSTYMNDIGPPVIRTAGGGRSVTSILPSNQKAVRTFRQETVRQPNTSIIFKCCKKQHTV